MNSRFRAKIGAVELELEGSETFLNLHLQNLESLLAKIKHVEPKRENETNTLPDNKDNDTDALTPQESELPQDLGEWLSLLPRDTTRTKQALVAAYFLQRQSNDGVFETGKVNELIQDQGIKVANLSQLFKDAKDNKIIFQRGRRGKIFQYRFNRVAEQSLIQLLRGQNVEIESNGKEE